MSGRLRFAAGVSLLITAASPCLVAQTLPAGFRDSVVFSGLSLPTAVAFSPDGRVFVAEKSGLIKVFASLTATTPTLFADLSTKVYNYWDRGLLGLALDPGFPDQALRLCPLHLRRGHRRPGAQVGHAGSSLRSVPEPARGRRPTAAP